VSTNLSWRRRRRRICLLHCNNSTKCWGIEGELSAVLERKLSLNVTAPPLPSLTYFDVFMCSRAFIFMWAFNWFHHRSAFGSSQCSTGVGSVCTVISEGRSHFMTHSAARHAFTKEQDSGDSLPLSRAVDSATWWLTGEMVEPRRSNQMWALCFVFLHKISFGNIQLFFSFFFLPAISDSWHAERESRQMSFQQVK